MKLLDYKQLKKFWSILGSKEFYISDLYGNNQSERDVFVRRVSRLLKKGIIVLNREKETPYMIDNKVFKANVSEIRTFFGIRHICDWSGSKIRLQFADIEISHLDLKYNDLLDIQYKYLNDEEMDIYDKYLKILYEPLEKENVVYLSQGLSDYKIKSTLKKYDLLNKVDLKTIKYCIKFGNLYISMGNTGRYNRYYIHYYNNDMFNILNKEDYEDKK